MLNNKQKKQLKSLANTLDAKYQIGKQEVTDTILDVLDKALTAHELIKVDILKSINTSVNEIALDIAVKLHAEIVQVLGHKVTLYRENKENHKIKLVK